MSNLDNIIIHTDSYKVSHHKQYPPKTEHVYSYFESRGGAFDETVFFGLQYYLKKWLAGFVVTAKKIDYAEKLFKAHFMGSNVFNRDGWEHILNAHSGRLPIRIRAVPEGSVIPTRNVLMTIENTDPKCFWLTNYLETLLVQVWYASTVATQSREMKRTLWSFLDGTSDDPFAALVQFKLHDFGCRGVTCMEQAGVGGMAHLINFAGTDTMPALIFAQEYYDADVLSENIPGFSIPAAEHSTICSWGRENEIDAFKNMLLQFPAGPVAVVSDTYDIYKACSDLWGTQLKDQVLSREGFLVVRPDSGDPPTVVVEVLTRLYDKFGGHVNSKGYKVLDPHVRVIQGDGIDRFTMAQILQAMKNNEFSAENIAFGSGGGLLQKLNRDTSKYAFKACQVTVDGEARDIWKDPVTDPGKASKRGRLKLVKTDDRYKTVAESDPGQDVLRTVFENGEIKVLQDFEDIRKRAQIKPLQTELLNA